MAIFGRTRRSAPPAAILGAFASAAASHVGRVRRVNEDRTLDRPDRGLWAVADGMGGLSRGDLAAETAIAALAALADAGGPLDADAVVDALADADRRLRADPEARGGGTTIVALLADTHGATLFWAGDSRAYRLTAARAVPLTRDHSLVAELVAAGALDPVAAEHHPQANVVTRAIGAGDPAPVERVRIAFAPGDRLMLASDGCYRSLAPGDAPLSLSVHDCATRLVANAVARDGSDNASCVVVERRV
ncbi:serine/threonine protein phosphatase [Sphingomonas spermidinifaciens]|uniref:Serine/threonine protein phosphatase n=1 Tax=Sphingomonas spermidinifaciens TaxID=1141889 RepID=A0A2A4B3L1_9SPHN|nr:protein phosphatase 2C domain-containing protein [Sphingomonas spermidinifaciens]PCD02670.1 serine/threonine protein phosphatase [Sphingomonas spermidinifaciens]